MISLTAIIVVFGLGWCIRKLWKIAVPAVSAAFASPPAPQQQGR